MSSVINETHKQIRQKLNIYGEIIQIDGVPGSLVAKYDDLVRNYYSISSPALLNAINGDLNVENEYFLAIISCNFTGQCDDLITELMNTCAEKLPRVRNALCQIERLKFSIKHEEYNSGQCMCMNNEGMTVVPESSELICPSCGAITTLFGTFFDDSQIFKDNGKYTPSTYRTARHYKYWIDKTQANDNKIIPQQDLDKIRKYIETTYPDDIDRERVDCLEMRKFLKILRLTKYNDDVPKLLKILIGKIPPQLNHEETQYFDMTFELAMSAYDRLERDNKIDRKNKIYIPFFIYKIAEHRFQNLPKIAILKYIHLQNQKTIVYNDTIWQAMCNLQTMGIKYIPTNEIDDE